MNTIDISFGQHSRDILKKSIGKSFDNYKTNPFENLASVYGIVGLKIAGKYLKLTNFTVPMKRYGIAEDVAVMKLEECFASDIKTCIIDGKMIEHPVNSQITKVVVVNEKQTLEKSMGEKYVMYLTRAIIYTMEDGLEIAFEKPVWFSEMINIKRGYNLLNQIVAIDIFLEEWEDCEGCQASCERTTIEL